MAVVSTAPRETLTVESGSRLRLGRVLIAARVLGQLVAEFVEKRPDIVHINTTYHWALVRDGLVVILAKLAGARVVMHFRGGTFPEFFRSLRSTIQQGVRFALRRVDRLIALDDGTYCFLRDEFGASRTRFLPNFVDLAEFASVPRRDDRSGAVEVLFVGWMIRAKGVTELLEAARRIPDAHFTLLGPAETAFVETLRPILDELADRVRVVSPRPRHAVLRFYNEADIFVLPTWREGFPNVVLEAMAAGLPVVSTRVGAIPQMITDEREGLLVDPRDVEGLTEAIARLTRSRDLRLELGRAARNRVESEFSLAPVTSRLGDYYAELFERNPEANRPPLRTL